METTENRIVNTFLKIHPKDNVLVALQNLPKATILQSGNDQIVLMEDIPAKHKLFINDMQAGQEIFMYGVLVGKVQYDVSAGERMTTDNTKHATGNYAYRGFLTHWHEPDVSKFKNRTFRGYKRSDGRVGTANYWLFVPTVFCENRNLDIIKEALYNELGYAVSHKYHRFTRQLIDEYEHGHSLDSIDLSPANDPVQNRLFKNIDGIKFLNHQGGCGGTRNDAAVLSKLLAAYADHPNVAGITVLSLGCQNLQTQDFLSDLKQRNPLFNKPVLIFEQQQSLSEEQLVANAIKQTFTGLIEANKFEREAAPLSKLTIGC